MAGRRSLRRNAVVRLRRLRWRSLVAGRPVRVEPLEQRVVLAVVWPWLASAWSAPESTVESAGNGDFSLVAEGEGGGPRSGEGGPPTAFDDFYETDADMVLHIAAAGVLANDIDPDGDPLFVESPPTTSALGAAVHLAPSGELTYDPTAALALLQLALGDYAIDSFEYTVSDGVDGSDTATVYITVYGVNDPPRGEPDEYATDEDTVLVVPGPGVLANDHDVDAGAVLSVAAGRIESTLGAIVDLDATGGFVYDPTGSAELQALPAGVTATDTFTYTLTDQHGATDVVTVSILVAGVNDAPIAQYDDYETDAGVALTIPAQGVLLNDSDPDGDPLSVIVDGPFFSDLGAWVDLAADGGFVYDPATSDLLSSLPPGMMMLDVFTYLVTDGESVVIGLVTIAVTGTHRPPLAVDDELTAHEDELLEIDPWLLLLNDHDLSGVGGLHVVAVDPVSALGAVLRAEEDGLFSYDPRDAAALQAVAAGDTTLDWFTYILEDGAGQQSTATVWVTVYGANDPPLAVDDELAGDEDTVLVIPAGDLTANDLDIDQGDELTIVAVSAVSALGAVVTLSAQQTVAYDPTGVAVLNALAVGQSLTDSFTYTVQDRSGAESSAEVRIIVAGRNDAPTASDFDLATDEDTPLELPAGALLATAADIDDGDTLAIDLFDSVSLLGAAVSVGVDGSLRYDPTSAATLQQLQVGEATLDEFQFRIHDQHGAGVWVTARVEVSGRNDAPVARGDLYHAHEDTILVVAASSSVLLNDSDIDGDALTVVDFMAVSALGALVQMTANGAFQYNATQAPLLQALAAGQLGEDHFTYTVDDGHGGQATATVTIVVLGANDRPLAFNNVYHAQTNRILAVEPAGVLHNDVDIDQGDELRVVGADSFSRLGAAVNIAADGSFSYDPRLSAPLRALAPGAIAHDTFQYTIADAAGATATALVTIAVTGVNPSPWRNPVDPLDVNGDGVVTNNDVLAIINALRANGVSILPDPPAPPFTPPPYLDVNGDGVLSINDALLIINHLLAVRAAQQNAVGVGEAGDGEGAGEGEGEVEPPPAAAVEPPLVLPTSRIAATSSPAGGQTAEPFASEPAEENPAESLAALLLAATTPRSTDTSLSTSDDEASDEAALAPPLESALEPVIETITADIFFASSRLLASRGR